MMNPEPPAGRKPRKLGPRSQEALEMLQKTSMWRSDLGYALVRRLARRGLVSLWRSDCPRCRAYVSTADARQKAPPPLRQTEMFAVEEVVSAKID